MIAFIAILVEDTSIQINPCLPSPCGPNAKCTERNDVGSCACLPGYIGNPYEGCRPECILDSDCSPTRACINSKCIDPCPGTCGTNAECRVINHRGSCTCFSGYTGDPYQYCSIQPIGKSRLFLISYQLSQKEIIRCQILQLLMSLQAIRVQMANAVPIVNAG